MSEHLIFLVSVLAFMSSCRYGPQKILPSLTKLPRQPYIVPGKSRLNVFFVSIFGH